MTNTDKMLLICFILSIIGMIIVAVDAYRTGHERGLREGWHRGRSVSRQEFWSE